MISKSDLDRRVADELGIPITKVTDITRAFLDEIRNALTDDGEVQLVGVGKLTARMETGNFNLVKDALNAPMRIKLYFKKSITLKRQIERKYGLREG